MGAQKRVGMKTYPPLRKLHRHLAGESTVINASDDFCKTLYKQCRRRLAGENKSSKEKEDDKKGNAIFFPTIAGATCGCGIMGLGRMNTDGYNFEFLGFGFFLLLASGMAASLTYSLWKYFGVLGNFGAILTTSLITISVFNGAAVSCGMLLLPASKGSPELAWLGITIGGG